jgi:hypothetical protein
VNASGVIDNSYNQANFTTNAKKTGESHAIYRFDDIGRLRPRGLERAVLCTNARAGDAAGAPIGGRNA